MRIIRKDEKMLILVNRPWFNVILTLFFTVGLVWLSISAFSGGETFLGLVFLFVAATFFTSLVSFGAFEQVLLDRDSGVVVVSGRNIFQSWSQTYPLSEVKSTNVIQKYGSGRRRRATFLPVLILHDPQQSKIPLSLVSAGHDRAQFAALAISEWMNGNDQTTVRSAHSASPLSILSIVGVNLSVVLPVLAGYWSIWELISFYWAELLVISVLFSCKAVIHSFTCRKRSAREYAAGVGFIILWVCAWVAGIYLSLNQMSYLRGESLFVFITDNKALSIPIAVMAASHLYGFIGSLFQSGSFDWKGVERYGEQPFARIFLLGFIILVAPLVMGLTNMQMLVLAIFVSLKLWLDCRAGNKISVSPRS